MVEQCGYSLKTSLAMRHEYFFETLMRMSFCPSKAHPDIRIINHGTHYEYCCIYMDVMFFIAKDPIKYIRTMQYEYQLTTQGEPENYLGGDMELVNVRKVSWSAKTYILKMVERIGKSMEKCLKFWNGPMKEEC